MSPLFAVLDGRHQLVLQRISWSTETGKWVLEESIVEGQVPYEYDAIRRMAAEKFAEEPDVVAFWQITDYFGTAETKSGRVYKVTTNALRTSMRFLLRREYEPKNSISVETEALDPTQHIFEWVGVGNKLVLPARQGEDAVIDFAYTSAH